MPKLILKAKGRPVFRHAGLVINNRFRAYDLTDEQAEAIRAYLGRFVMEQAPSETTAPSKPASARKRRRT